MREGTGLWGEKLHLAVDIFREGMPGGTGWCEGCLGLQGELWNGKKEGKKRHSDQGGGNRAGEKIRGGKGARGGSGLSQSKENGA